MLYLDSLSRKHRSVEPSEYPFSVPAVRSIDKLVFRSRITFFAGDNGSGKSTLLEGLAAGMRAYSIGNHGQVVDDPYLPHARTVADAFYLARKTYPHVRMFMRADDVLGYVRRINEERLDEYRYRSERLRQSGADVPEETPDIMREIIEHNEIDTRSHGEGFLDMLQQRIHGGGLYFLDEPESPLSPVRQLALADLIRSAASDGAQFFIATHSLVLMAIPEAQIFHFDESGVEEMRFEDLESVHFLRRFLADPGRYMSD